MRINAESRWFGTRLVSACLLVLFPLAGVLRGAASEQAWKIDCGVDALFILLWLEGRQATLDRLDAALPPRRPDGYSMGELKAAAANLGLILDGVRFNKGDKPLKRPAIAFLEDGSAGHFAVLRPVGTTGTMVQVIDPPHVPWIADYERILSTRSWTGRILVPREPRFARLDIEALRPGHNSGISSANKRNGNRAP